MSQTQSTKKQTQSQNQLNQTRPNTSMSTRGIVTRKEYERQKKLKTTVRAQSLIPAVNNVQKPVITAKKSHKPPRAIYNLPLTKLQSIQSHINEELRSFRQEQVQKQNIDAQLYVTQKVLYQLDKIMLLNLYCRSFQLVDKDLPDKDVSWTRLMKR